MAAEPAVQCESGKLKVASKYAACLLKADAKAVSKGETADYSKCDSKFSDKWRKTEDKAGPGVCPSEGDEADVQGFLDACDASVADALAGGTLLLDPVVCNGALDACDAASGTCDTSLSACTSALSSTNSDLGVCNGGLVTCNFDLSSTNADLGNCNSDLSTTNADLAALNAEMRCPTSGVAGAYTATITQPDPSPPSLCLSTLEVSAGVVTSTTTACDNGAPDAVATGTVEGNLMELAEEPSANCSGFRAEISLLIDNNCATGTGTLVCRTGVGGAIFASTPITTARLEGPYFESSVGGDATVFDIETGLEWVVTDDAGGLTDWDNAYNWSTGDNSFNGTAKTAYIDGLNAANYGGHNDWRLPGVDRDGGADELETIQDPAAAGCGGAGACIDQNVFGPTKSDLYWSSTTDLSDPAEAWTGVFFATGVGAWPKTLPAYARAVRTGP